MKRMPVLVLSALLLFTVSPVSVMAFDEGPGFRPRPAFDSPDSDFDYPRPRFREAPPGGGPGGGPPGRGFGGPPGGPPPGGPGNRFGRQFRPEMPGRGMGDLVQRLDLTSEQKEELRQIQLKFSDATRKARMAVKSLRDEKMTMLAAGKLDMEKLAALDEQILKAQMEVLRERLKMRRDRLRVLNSDQIRRVGDFFAESQFGTGGRAFAGPGARRGMREW